MNIHLWAPTFGGFGGGIGVFGQEVATALRTLDHSAYLAGKFDCSGNWQGLPLWGAGNFPPALRSAGFAAGTFALSQRLRPDRVVSTHINFGPAANFVRRMLGTKYILVAHGVDVHPYLSRSRQHGLRDADRIIAVSRWTRDRLLEISGIHAERISILPNTVDTRRFTVGPRPAYLLKRYGIEQGETVVLTVARLDTSEAFVPRNDRPRGGPVTGSYKGCDRLILALPHIQSACGSVKYVIVGKGPDRQRLEAMARGAGVSSSVTFAGFVPPEELADHYRLADVFAMPSTAEGFGIVFLEAMACGTPVLGGNMDGSVDALGGGELGLLVDPTNVHAIAHGLIALLRKQGPAAWFERERLHEMANTRFGHEVFQRTLADILAS